MKKPLLISAILFLTMSCNKPINNNNDGDLSSRVAELEKQNKMLRDSLTHYEESFLYSQILVGVPDVKEIKVGKKNKIVMLFQTFNKELPKYEIYKVEDGKQIKVGENNQTRFDYDFTPKSTKDNEVDLLVKLPYNGKIIEIPAGLIFEVKN